MAAAEAATEADTLSAEASASAAEASASAAEASASAAEDQDFEDLLDYDDEWEDEDALADILERLPNGWFLIKVTGFTATSFAEMDEWLVDNCRCKFERIGWRSGCSYMVGVQFENSMDAVYFRLRWTA